jgi:hypothetical protein
VSQVVGGSRRLDDDEDNQKNISVLGVHRSFIAGSGEIRSPSLFKSGECRKSPGGRIPRVSGENG